MHMPSWVMSLLKYRFVFVHFLQLFDLSKVHFTKHLLRIDHNASQITDTREKQWYSYLLWYGIWIPVNNISPEELFYRLQILFIITLYTIAFYISAKATPIAIECKFINILFIGVCQCHVNWILICCTWFITEHRA